VFAQQSLQPKLSRRRYASVSYALQNNSLQTRTELSQCQWWIKNRQWEWVPQCWTRNSKTSLAVSHYSAAWNCKVTRTAERRWQRQWIAEYIRNMKNQMVFYGKPFNDMPLPERCILYFKWFLTISSLDTTVTFDLVTSKCNQSTFIHKCSDLRIWRYSHKWIVRCRVHKLIIYNQRWIHWIHGQMDGHKDSLKQACLQWLIPGEGITT